MVSKYDIISMLESDSDESARMAYSLLYEWSGMDNIICDMDYNFSMLPPVYSFGPPPKFCDYTENVSKRFCDGCDLCMQDAEIPF